MRALEEVLTAMSDFSREEERCDRLTISTQASAKAAKLAHQRYDGRLDSILVVVLVERQLLEAQDLLAISDIQVATDLVFIYRALGAGDGRGVDHSKCLACRSLEEYSFIGSGLWWV